MTCRIPLKFQESKCADTIHQCAGPHSSTVYTPMKTGIKSPDSPFLKSISSSKVVLLLSERL